MEGGGVEDALRRLLLAADNGGALWRLLLIGLIIAPLAIALPRLIYSSDVGNPLSPELRAGLAASAVLLVFTLWFTASLRRRVRTRLESSDLPGRIADGSLLEDDLIFSATPWPWRRLLGCPSVGKDELLNVLLRVGTNLDWYLAHASDASKRLWRWQWIYSPLAGGLACYYYIWLYGETWGAGIALVDEPDYLPWHLAALLLALPLPLLHIRRQIWMEELAACLRRRLLQ